MIKEHTIKFYEQNTVNSSKIIKRKSYFLKMAIQNFLDSCNEFDEFGFQYDFISNNLDLFSSFSHVSITEYGRLVFDPSKLIGTNKVDEFFIDSINSVSYFLEPYFSSEDKFMFVQSISSNYINYMDQSYMSYKDLLKEPEWHNKRIEVIKNKGGKCIECGKSEKLQVHHNKYRDTEFGILWPWLYNDDEMNVMCQGCHYDHHRLQVQKGEMESFISTLRIPDIEKYVSDKIIALEVLKNVVRDVFITYMCMNCDKIVLENDKYIYFYVNSAFKATKTRKEMVKHQVNSLNDPNIVFVNRTIRLLRHDYIPRSKK